MAKTLLELPWDKLWKDLTCRSCTMFYLLQVVQFSPGLSLLLLTVTHSCVAPPQLWENLAAYCTSAHQDIQYCSHCHPDHGPGLPIAKYSLLRAIIFFSVFPCFQSESRWKQLADLALGMSELGLAKQCLVEAKDYNGQLLLATSTGDRNTVQCMADEAKTAGKNNVAFLANYLLGK